MQSSEFSIKMAMNGQADNKEPFVRWYFTNNEKGKLSVDVSGPELNDLMKAVDSVRNELDLLLNIS